MERRGINDTYSPPSRGSCYRLGGQLSMCTIHPLTMEFSKRTGHFVNDLERMKEAFGRLLGAEWEDAWKVGADYSPDPERRYLYYERSVFEVKSSDEAEEE